MLYLVGLGLDHDSISKRGLEIAKRCKRIYVENYTVDFPYALSVLEQMIGKKIKIADRKFVESLELIDEATNMDVVLLVYGSPLTATTHIALLEEAKKSKVKTAVIHNASVLDAVAGTGLQLYKFGKTTSMPKWEKNFTPDSFIETIQHNFSMRAHSLILIDIGLKFKDALKQLEEASEKNNLSIKELVVCQALGTKRQRIIYSEIENLKEIRWIIAPYCFVIPSKMHFLEKEFLEHFRM